MCWSLPPDVTGFWDGAFKKVSQVKWGHQGGWSNRTGVHIEEQETPGVWTPWKKTIQGHGEEAAVCKAERDRRRKRALRRLDLQPLTVWGNECPSREAPGPWDFVIAPQDDECIYCLLTRTRPSRFITVWKSEAGDSGLRGWLLSLPCTSQHSSSPCGDSVFLPCKWGSSCLYFTTIGGKRWGRVCNGLVTN